MSLCKKFFFGGAFTFLTVFKFPPNRFFLQKVLFGSSFRPHSSTPFGRIRIALLSNPQVGHCGCLVFPYTFSAVVFPFVAVSATGFDVVGGIPHTLLFYKTSILSSRGSSSSRGDGGRSMMPWVALLMYFATSSPPHRPHLVYR